MFRSPFARHFLIAVGVGALLCCGTAAQAQDYAAPPPAPINDTAPAPGRVARLAYLSGPTQFAPAGGSGWGTADLNRPMVVGDRLVTGSGGLAVIELGDASVRLDHDSAFDFLNLTQGNVQIELSQGTLNAAVRQLAPGENFEVDTPTVAFVATAPGIYRIDDSPTGIGSMVTVFQGAGTVYGENGVSRDVAAGSSYRFNDSNLASVDVTGLPAPDDFDRFCEARDQQYQRYAQQSKPYVAPDMIGGDQLAQYGQWGNVPEYGNVWYPASVPVGWAPYRYGRWVWIDPWGWTWMDNQPWGFAPFHYGRWVYIANRWGWVPGPIRVRPVYAPAMVAFLGGSGLSLSLNVGGGPVGWFPLGPRDVYVPWFAASQTYFNQVNITNIRVVNRTVINNYYAGYRGGRLPHGWQRNYAYRDMAGAVTAVPRTVFTGARPVHSAVLRLDRTQLARTQVAFRPGINPDAASLGAGHRLTRPTVLKGAQPFTRPVVARREPAPRPVAFATRERAIAQQHGQPLTEAQLRDLRPTRPAPEGRNERVRMVRTAAAGNTPAATPGPRPGQRPVGPAPRIVENPGTAAPRPGSATRRPIGSATPGVGTVRPIQAPVHPAGSPESRGEALPSARFAHPESPRNTLPRAPVIRPADEAQRRDNAPNRLPVVRPVEAAPRPVRNQAEGSPQPQRAAEVQQQRTRDAAVQQQARERQMQQQAQQRQAQSQRATEMQQQRTRDAAVQQQARERQMQQQAQQRQAQSQRAAEMQQQRTRDAAVQQQARERQMQQQAQQRQAQSQRAAEMQQQRTRDAAVQQQARERQMQQQAQQRQFQQPRPQQFQQRPVRVAPPQERPAPEQRQPPERRHPPQSSGERPR